MYALHYFSVTSWARFQFVCLDDSSTTRIVAGIIVVPVGHTI